MSNKDTLTLVYDCIDELNRQLPAGSRLVKSPDTALLGEGSTLDSLSLINFIVAFEEALQSQRAISCNLLEEACLTDPDGPLRNVRSLVEFVERSGD